MNNLSQTPLPCLPERASDSHKGDYGHAWIVGGSRGMAGAPALAGKACLRCGAGRVSLAVPESIQPTVSSFQPDYMALALPEEAGQLSLKSVDSVNELLESATAGAIGPGLGRSPEITNLVAQLYSTITSPLVVDADALFALAQRAEILAEPAGPRILTPHAGEFARLIDCLPADLGSAETRLQAASDLARQDPTHQTLVLLKGNQTLISNGEDYAVNTTGNPGMATGGSGDVLSGMITALLCQGLSPFDAARLGAHVHGLAGDLAVAELGQISLIASDLIDWIPRAWKSVSYISK